VAYPMWRGTGHHGWTGDQRRHTGKKDGRFDERAGQRTLLWS
jgi:hypothetical protein